MNKPKKKNRNKIFCTVIEILLFLSIMYLLISNLLLINDIHKIKGGRTETELKNIEDKILTNNLDNQIKPNDELVLHRKPYNGSDEARCYLYVSEPYGDKNDKVSIAFPPKVLKGKAWESFSDKKVQTKFSWLDIIEN